MREAMVPHNGIGSTSASASSSSSHTQDLFRSRPTSHTLTSNNSTSFNSHSGSVAGGVGGENDNNNHIQLDLERSIHNNYHNHMTEQRGNNTQRGNNRLPFGGVASNTDSNSNAQQSYWKVAKNKKNSDCEEPDDSKVLLDNQHNQSVVDEEEHENERVSKLVIKLIFGKF